MDDLKNHFLQRSIAGLQEVSVRLREGDTGAMPDTFRTLHTIKGTAQTFGFAEAARIAHKLEDLLEGRPGGLPPDRDLLLDGISLLIKSLNQTGPVDTEGFSKRVGDLDRDNAPRGAVFISMMPFETLDRFSDHERDRLFSANDAGQGIYRIDAAFDLADFTNGFKEFKGRLESFGETIATLPGENSSGRIGFRIYFAACPETAKLASLCTEHSARFERVNTPEGAITAPLLLIGKHGSELAASLGKKVEIIISIDNFAGETGSSQLIFDTLLHLVRNAIDHAFDKTGTIRIGVTSTDKGLTITVGDNGRGIDLEKLRTVATQKGLSADGDLADLIFQQGVSTADEVSEISGRGVGLDAVRTMVENAGGSISVKSETGRGTTFEIYLPMRKSERE
jgi:two-component system, chemotaxis family, sensor kinase CheA